MLQSIADRSLKTDSSLVVNVASAFPHVTPRPFLWEARTMVRHNNTVIPTSVQSRENEQVAHPKCRGLVQDVFQSF